MPAGYIGSVEEDLKPLLFVFAQIGVSHKTSLFCFLFVLCGVAVSHKKAIPIFLQEKGVFWR